MYFRAYSRLKYDVVKVVSVLSYMTILGWVVAFFIYGDHRSALAKFHLRDSLGLIITGALLALVPFVGWVLCLGIIVLWCTGFYHALTGQRTHLPVVGDFYQKHLDFIR
ncbi:MULTISPECIES: hypothetical protein [Thalassotalea]|uniref:hypothetical protein n=1 Tax=Thalassotalea TaxID=1518149 RepID=UPI000942B99A|nr:MULTISPECIES: hypothetical protein [Thalassotalea]OKY24937.1 hypothetical protein BI291_04235 [Thalassotalea sp. PP2-459]